MTKCVFSFILFGWMTNTPVGETVTEKLAKNIEISTSYDNSKRLFPDHDCRNIENPVVNWNELRETFYTACAFTKYTWSLQCSAMVVNWNDGLKFLEDYTDFAVEQGKKHASFRRIAKQQCPLGYLTVMIVRLLHCVLKQAMRDCFLPYSVAIREQLRAIDYKVFIGSDWPVFALLNTVPWSQWPDYDRNMDFNCERSGNSILDWQKFQSIFDWPFDVDLEPFEMSVSITQGTRLFDRAIDTPERFDEFKRKKKFKHLPIPASGGANSRDQDIMEINEVTNAVLLMDGLPDPSAEEQLIDQESVPEEGYVRQDRRDKGESFVYFSTKDLPQPVNLDPTFRVNSRIVLPDAYKTHYKTQNGTIDGVDRIDLDSLLRTPLRPFQTASGAHYYSDYRCWWLDSIRYVYSQGISHQTGKASAECLYGVYTANIIKALWAADTESSAFTSYSMAISQTFFESLQFIGASRWPIFALLDHGRSLRRHRFLIDFQEEELDIIHKHMGPWLQSLEPETHRKVISVYVPALEALPAAKEHKLDEMWKTSVFSKKILGEGSKAADDDVKATAENFEQYLQVSRMPFQRLQFQETVRVIVQAGIRLRFLYVSFVYGAYTKYIKGWIRRLKFLGVENMLLYTLDSQSYEECLRWSAHYESKTQCLRGITISSLNKFTILLVCLQLGFDVFWLDLDIFLVKNPTPTVMQMTRGNPEGEIPSAERHDYRRIHREKMQRGENYLVNSEIELPSLIGDDFSVLTGTGEERYHNVTSNPDTYIPLSMSDSANDYGPEDELSTDERLKQDPDNTHYDFLIAYSFVSDCICNGFFYIKSKPVNVDWLKELIVWLYQHPFEHDQRAMSALLNYTEKIGFPPGYTPPRVPNWFVFDVRNQFINWPRWTGSLEDMILIHFVDGAAFSLYGRGEWDASIPADKHKEGSMLDVFYRKDDDEDGNEQADQFTPWKRKLVLKQRVDAPVEQRQKCGILPNVDSAHEGTGWVDSKVREKERR